MYNNQHHKFLTQYNHKLFAHCNRWGNDVIDYISELKPKVIKFLDANFENVQRVRELVSDAILIYRQWQPNQNLGNSEFEAFQLGVQFAQKISSEAIINQGLVDLVEGYNEILGETAPVSEHRKYAQFQLGFKQGLGGLSVEPVAFNFGTGNMSHQLILDYYSDVLDTYNWLGFHEYDWPAMDRLHNQGLTDGNGGMWLALRYRRIMEPIIQSKGNNWSVIVTECGMTQGVLAGQDVGFQYSDNTTPPNRGWSDYPTPISNDNYWNTLQWYSNELMKDDYVVGACMFTTGSLSPWQSFETIGTITPKIKSFQKVVSNGNEMTEIFVNDLRRGTNDPSLVPVPLIETFEELKQVFGLDVDTSLGYDAVNVGEWYWRLIGFELKTGPKIYQTEVRDSNGNPTQGIVVFRHWPSAPSFSVPINPSYFTNGVGGATNQNGHVGMEYTGTSVIKENGGPDYIWLSADPPNGLRKASDMASRLGWHGATNHLTPNPVFQAVQKSGIIPPPNSDSRLVVYDNDGQIVGHVSLITGGGTGGRIALFSGGVEQAHVELE